jgi:hypothetical protein
MLPRHPTLMRTGGCRGTGTETGSILRCVCIW